MSGPSRTRRVVFYAVGVVIVLVAASIPAGRYLAARSERQAQLRAAQTFAAAWRSGRLQTLDVTGVTPQEVAARTQQATASLTAATADRPSSVTVSSVREQAASGGTVARLRVTWALGGGRTWRYLTSLPLRGSGTSWTPAWSPQVIHPDLPPGGRLVATSVPAVRGQIIGADEQVLVTERDVVTVGLRRSATQGLASAVTAVAEVTGVQEAPLQARMRAAPKDAVVEVITLRRSAFEELRSSLSRIPDVVLTEGKRSLAPTSTFAQALLGRVGPATAEIVQDSKGRVRAGDQTGLSGLQRSYDTELAGTSGFAVRAVGTGTAPDGGWPELFRVDPVAGSSVRLTLDRTVQDAADAALRGADKPAGLVAIEPSSGNVLAVANGGPNAAGYDRALLGRYPPGSTFKIVSTLGLLTGGLKTNSTVPCPASITVGGRTFRNAEGEVLGRVPFRTDFADSCNTAFIRSARRLSPGKLADAATSLGFGQQSRLGVPAFTGSVPSSGGDVAHAAAMIGQGTVLASPLTMAGASAAVAAGRWTSPRLVLGAGERAAAGTGTDPSTASLAPVTPAGASTAAGGAPETVGLPPAAVRDLRSLMRAVVTDGTGRALRKAKGGPVAGKTGTAEFGTDDPPATHAWFTGYQGGVAFAVVVEDGGFGAEAAVPIVADFLNRLAS
jgi:cell division protein FtsI/penicillin-binding protein 2